LIDYASQQRLNEAFGEGWEKECFPIPNRWSFPAGPPGESQGRGPVGRDPGGREAVQADPRQLPEVHRGDADERRRLYCWLQKNMDTTSGHYTDERANKLFLAFFGDRWQAECFFPGPSMPRRFQTPSSCSPSAFPAQNRHSQNTNCICKQEISFIYHLIAPKIHQTCARQGSDVVESCDQNDGIISGCSLNSRALAARSLR